MPDSQFGFPVAMLSQVTHVVIELASSLCAYRKGRDFSQPTDMTVVESV